MKIVPVPEWLVPMAASGQFGWTPMGVPHIGKYLYFNGEWVKGFEE